MDALSLSLPDRSRPDRSHVVAVLGPTNTGKTHLAMERMLGHASGMIGFPLRLLARENYERAVAARGRDQVALITGEEKILPAGARYFLCTTESMPLDRRVAFLGLDEVQMCADPDRGHVFTDRLLHARGEVETMFMGAETIRPLLRRLVPDASFIARPRFSTLSWAGTTKVSRLPPRSAVVAFSISDVYAIAELIRRERGGAALVLGALSPRTRNAQVALYQAGEVDYLVATDAIGMGLNMNVEHVAFAATRKFDGRRRRVLTAPELAQIAGRAGRYTRDGTFGTTADIGPMPADVVDRIENHQFDALRTLQWRNSDLDTTSLKRLKASLTRAPNRPELKRARQADDEMLLDALSRDAEVTARAGDPAAVRLLWEICRVPDFGNVAHDHHSRLVAQLFRFLAGESRREIGRLPTDWVARQVDAIDRTDGDIDALMQRIANIRTWTYIAHQAAWLDDAEHWRQRTRRIEDTLSDTLHDRLIQRFVDRRTASLVGRLKARDNLMAAVTSSGGVLVEGHAVGTLDGFRFVPDPAVAADDRAAGRAVLNVTTAALRREVGGRVRALEDDEDVAFRLDDVGEIRWRDAPVARLASGSDVLSPQVEILPTDLLLPAERERVRRRVVSWLRPHLENALPSLFLARRTDTAGAVRGLLFQLAEGLGVLDRRDAQAQVPALTAHDRATLRRLGMRIERRAIYVPELLKPAALALRTHLWCAYDVARTPPPPELAGAPVSLALTPAADRAAVNALGYRCLGPRVVRVDMVERLLVRAEGLARRGDPVAPGTLAALIGCRLQDVGAVLADLGFTTSTDADGLRLRAGAGRRQDRRPRRTARSRPHKDSASPFAGLSELSRRQ